MPAILLSAKPVVDEIKAALKKSISEWKHSLPPKLVVVLVGEDPASQIYTKRKGEAAVEVGMLHENIHLPATVTPGEVQTVLNELNEDPSVHGILLQRPLPPAFREEEMVNWIAPEKDVDGFHPINTGKLVLGFPSLAPCTPTGIMALLRHYQISVEGKVACVIGRSSIVGKPMASLLLQANASVIQTHSKTQNLKFLTQLADILIVAAGKPQLVDDTFIKKGAVIIDVGIHRLKDGSVCGDVNAERVLPIASALTPVPGGVGPLTIATLLQNTLLAAQNQSQKN